MRKVVQDAAKQFADSPVTITHVHHPNHNFPAENGYFKLSRHFGWALGHVFNNLKAKRVIILEEDLEIAPDFFDMFAAVKALVDEDESILCASAWNDNGSAALARDNKLLYRSDFFPGLGWMMPERIWRELEPKWPRAYWDDWLREPPQRKGRHIIRPEVCRTFHYGSIGVSNSQYSQVLKIITNSQITMQTCFT